MQQTVTSMQEIETGNFAGPRWVLCEPSFIRVVDWNINRGLQLQRVIEFLAGAKADIILLQEADLNARRTHHLDIAREIAQKLQLNYVFGREFQELTSRLPQITCVPRSSHTLSLAIVKFPHPQIPKAIEFLAPALVPSGNRSIPGKTRRTLGADQRGQHCGENDRYL